MSNVSEYLLYHKICRDLVKHLSVSTPFTTQISHQAAFFQWQSVSECVLPQDLNFS